MRLPVESVDISPGVSTAGAGASWKRMLEEGRHRSAVEIAEASGVTRTFVNRLLRLTLLAPGIVEAILEGRQAKRLMFEELISSMPSVWEQQHQRFACP